MDKRETIYRLEDLREQVLECLNEMETLLSDTGGIGRRAEVYWLAHARISMGTDRYLDSSHSLSDTIQELEEQWDE